MNRALPWIIGAIVFFVLAAYVFSGSLMFSPMQSRTSVDMMYGSADSLRYNPYLSQGADFAPQIEERQYSSTSTLSVRVDRPSFDDTVEQTRTIVTSAGGYLLDQNVREVSGAKRARFSIRIPDDRYDDVQRSLASLGTVLSLEENTKDVTGQYARTDVELEAERSRLKRLEELYDERPSLNEKLRVEGAIFDQERRVRYLERQLETVDQQVSYSTITFSLETRPNAFSDHSFITLRNLISILLGSIQALIAFIVAVGPWVLVGGSVWWLIRRFR